MLDSNKQKQWITLDLLCLLFQNFLLEEDKKIVSLNLEIWRKVIDLIILLDSTFPKSNLISNLFGNDSLLFSVWFGLLMTPIGLALNPKLIGNEYTNFGNVSVHDKAMIAQDLTIIDRCIVINGRIHGALAIGIASSAVSVRNAKFIEKSVFEYLKSHLQSCWAGHRVYAAVIIDEWGLSLESRGAGDSISNSQFANDLSDVMNVELVGADSGASLLYEELKVHLNLVRQDCCAFFSLISSYGVQVPLVPNIPTSQSSVSDVFSAQLADHYLNDYFPSLIASVSESESLKSPTTPTRHSLLNDKVSMVKVSIEKYYIAQRNLESRVLGSISSAVIRLKKFPPKLNPVIRSLMNFVKYEANTDFQSRAADGVSRLIESNIMFSRPQTVNDKIISNLAGFLTDDQDFVGNVSKVLETEGIYTLVGMEGASSKDVDVPVSVGRRKKKDSIVPVPDALSAITEASTLSNEENEARIVVRRGSESAFESIFALFGSHAFDACPKILEVLFANLFQCSESELISRMDADIDFAQLVVNNIFIVGRIVPFINSELSPKLSELIYPICSSLTSCRSVIRNAASKSLASISKAMTLSLMQILIEKVLPLLGDSKHVINRQGASECVFHVINALEDTILPYIIFLIVPILGRMSDPDESVRFISTNIFAQLIKLIPLESNVPDPEGISEHLILQRQEERKFLGQLVGTEKVESFELCVDIKAELRPYQKEGVSWLAFLNRYGLHGILCDDMGLGKTLQSICMLASDHHLRAEKYAKTGSQDSIHTPSIVICPPTLVQHWFFEIKKYAEFMTALLYIGNPFERSR